MNPVVEEGLWIVAAVICLGVRFTVTLILELVRPFAFLLSKAGVKF